MTARLRIVCDSVAASMALAVTFSACAQGVADNVASDSATSGQRFVGVAVGKPHYGTSCGSVAGVRCSNNGTSYGVTAGDMFTRDLGVSLSYLDFGKADRAGGSVEARGLNASVLGRLPLGDNFGLDGKVGTTYGVTHVRAPAESGVATGRGKGFGVGYGVAMDVDIVRGLQGSVGWEQHDFHFAGQGMSNVRNVTVSLAYAF